MMLPMGIPSLIMSKAINWLAPAKTITENKPVSSSEMPTFLARSPKAIATGKKPKIRGRAAISPSLILSAS